MWSYTNNDDIITCDPCPEEVVTVNIIKSMTDILRSWKFPKRNYRSLNPRSSVCPSLSYQGISRWLVRIASLFKVNTWICSVRPFHNAEFLEHNNNYGHRKLLRNQSRATIKHATGYCNEVNCPHQYLIPCSRRSPITTWTTNLYLWNPRFFNRLRIVSQRIFADSLHFSPSYWAPVNLSWIEARMISFIVDTGTFSL